MGFTQTTITSVNPPVILSGGFARISWTTSAPAWTWFQVYVEDVLSWHGQSTTATLAIPTVGPLRVDIGSVTDPSEASTSFASLLPAAPARRALISWQGGTATEGADLTSFNIYGSPGPNLPVSFTKPIANVLAFPGGSPQPTGSWSWESPPNISGIYMFAVVPVDSVGNEGPRLTTTVTIAVPPLEVPPWPDGLRLHYTVNNPGLAPGTNPSVTLTWLPSIG